MKALRTLTMSVSLMLAMSAAACGGGDSTTSPNPNPGAAAVASVSVTPSAASIDAGATQALTVVTRDAQGNTLTGRPIAYTSNAPQVATVANDGVVTGVAAGSARITATSEGKSAEATINVNAVAVASVTLTPTTGTIDIGAAITLVATARDAQGNTLANRAITYASNAPQVATVAANGVVTGVTAGSARITATSEGKSAEAAINVNVAAVASVTLTPTTGTVDIGNAITLVATARDAQGNTLTDRAITYASNAPQIATVGANGVVTGVGAGSARITASSEGKSAEATITVRAVVASIEIIGTLDSLEAYDVRQLAAIAKDANGQPINGVAFAWSSSNAAVLTVGAADGIATGIDRGTVTVTAQAAGKTHSVTRVVVIKYRSLALGTQHACDIASGGIAWCWGVNGTDARLGDATVGDGVYKSTPVRVPGGHRFTQLVTFARFTCGLRTDNKAYCWGNNGWGALGGGTNAGYSATPVAVSGNIEFARLSAGLDHACGVTVANVTYCWGHNDWGQFGIGNTTSPATPVVAPNGLALKDIDAGPAFSCGIAMNNAAYCWGANGLGQTGEGTQMSYGNTFRNTPAPVAGNLQFAQLSLGSEFACGLTTAGQAYCWGSNGSKLGDGTTADASSPRLVAGGYTFRQLATGFGHSCAVSVQDDIYCWGANGNGQLGAAGASATSPVRSAGSLKAAEVAVAGIGTGSGSFTCAVSKDRLTSYCWGRNEFGQLGNGATSTTAAVNANPTIVVGQKPL